MVHPARKAVTLNSTDVRASERRRSCRGECRPLRSRMYEHDQMNNSTSSRVEGVAKRACGIALG